MQNLSSQETRMRMRRGCANGQTGEDMKHLMNCKLVKKAVLDGSIWIREEF